MTKKDEKILKWRLAEKPTAQNLQDLVKSEIITKEEARQILLDETQFNSKDFDDVLNEITLLRKLVLELSNIQPTTIVKIVKEYVPHYPGSWTIPYVSYCSATSGNTSNAIGITDQAY